MYLRKSLLLRYNIKFYNIKFEFNLDVLVFAFGAEPPFPYDACCSCDRPLYPALGNYVYLVFSHSNWLPLSFGDYSMSPWMKDKNAAIRNHPTVFLPSVSSDFIHLVLHKTALLLQYMET